MHEGGLKGLSNLGNTCYMNSALQSIANTPQLIEYFVKDKYIGEINQDNPLGTSGDLAESFAHLMKNIWISNMDLIAPRELKSSISRFAPQFRSYFQQDSQEFLGFLLDGLHEDLNRVHDKKYMEFKEQQLPDEELSHQQWEYHLSRNNSIIVDLFQGQFKSTITCLCKNKSIKFDPFMTLTLPIPLVEQFPVKVFFVPFVGCLQSTLVFLDDKNIESIRKFSPFPCILTNEQFELNEFSKTVYCFESKEGDCFFMFPTKNNEAIDVPFLVYDYDEAQTCLKNRYQTDIEITLSKPQKHLDKVPCFGDFDELLKSPVFKEPFTWNPATHSRVEKLDVLNKRSSKSLRVSLQDCLEEFQKEELLGPKDPVYCSKCKNHVQASKQVTIFKYPNVLVIALKRFSAKKTHKLDVHVDFPFHLNKYKLYAVINHYGGLSGGHYTAYVKNAFKNNWHEFDDSRVSQIDEEQVRTSNAYVLFYTL